MTADELRTLQAPLKTRYREDPSAAGVTLSATGRIEPSAPGCRVDTAAGPVAAGLHEAAGGDGSMACSGTMLLEALAGCAGVTLAAVATAMGVDLRGGTVRAEGDLDFRGTLGVSKDVPVGLRAVRLRFELDTDAPQDQLRKLVELTERYCVVYRTLAQPPELTTSVETRGPLPLGEGGGAAAGSGTGKDHAP
jgi:uncharacterized OsmC-like protein